MFKSWRIAIVGCGLLLTHQAQAALGGLETTRQNVGFNDDNLWVIIPRLMNWLFSFLGVIFLALMLVGGIMWMTAMGNETQTKKAKDLLTAGVIGLVVVGAAYAITAFLGDTFGPK